MNQTEWKLDGPTGHTHHYTAFLTRFKLVFQRLSSVSFSTQKADRGGISSVFYLKWIKLFSFFFFHFTSPDCFLFPISFSSQKEQQQRQKANCHAMSNVLERFLFFRPIWLHTDLRLCISCYDTVMMGMHHLSLHGWAMLYSHSLQESQVSGIFIEHVQTTFFKRLIIWPDLSGFLCHRNSKKHILPQKPFDKSQFLVPAWGRRGCYHFSK